MTSNDNPQARGAGIGIGAGIGGGVGMIATMLLGAEVPLGLVFGAGLGVRVGLLVESFDRSRDRDA
jgi:hypothetical protein